MTSTTNRIDVNDAIDFIAIAKSIAKDTETLWLEQGLPDKKVKTVRYDFESDTISTE
jgi:hypothetical protein